MSRGQTNVAIAGALLARGARSSTTSDEQPDRRIRDAIAVASLALALGPEVAFAGDERARLSSLISLITARLDADGGDAARGAAGDVGAADANAADAGAVIRRSRLRRRIS